MARGTFCFCVLFGDKMKILNGLRNAFSKNHLIHLYESIVKRASVLMNRHQNHLLSSLLTI